MLYRKKPLIVKAKRFDWPDDVRSDSEYVEKLAEELSIIKKPSDFYIEWVLPVIENESLIRFVKIAKGDWVITGVNGERYPCTNDVFEKTYEKV